MIVNLAIALGVIFLVCGLLGWNAWRHRPRTPTEYERQMDEFAKACADLQAELGKVLIPPMEILARKFNDVGLAIGRAAGAQREFVDEYEKIPPEERD